jgi:hypothetical protein
MQDPPGEPLVTVLWTTPAVSPYLDTTVARMTEHQRRIVRARLLRRQGKTYDEIRAVTGRIPRPPQTHRSHPLTAERRPARQLRTAGATYDETAAAAVA